MTTTSQTQSALKKYFYSGVGLAASTSDIVKKTVDELVKQGRVNETDGKKIVNEAMQKLEDRYNEAVHKLGTFTTSEISMLKSKIEKLEKQISMHNGTVAGKKTVAKKVAQAVHKAKSEPAKAVKAVKKTAKKAVKKVEAKLK